MCKGQKVQNAAMSGAMTARHTGDIQICNRVYVNDIDGGEGCAGEVHLIKIENNVTTYGVTLDNGEVVEDLPRARLLTMNDISRMLAERPRVLRIHLEDDGGLSDVLKNVRASHPLDSVLTGNPAPSFKQVMKQYYGCDTDGDTMLRYTTRLVQVKRGPAKGQYRKVRVY